jgi:hypothetical protein
MAGPAEALAFDRFEAVSLGAFAPTPPECPRSPSARKSGLPFWTYVSGPANLSAAVLRAADAGP